MFLKKSLHGLLTTALLAGLAMPVTVLNKGITDQKNRTAVVAAEHQGVLWHRTGNIAGRNLYYGAGSSDRAPQGVFKLLAVDRNGSQPKFDVEDSHGVKWKVKVGEEAQAETAATRLLWAVGYFVDETYYLPEMRVEGLNKALEKGPMPNGWASSEALIGARLVRIDPDEKVIQKEWSWFDNPFSDTKAMNGLRVMMALINNWDLKSSNNKIVEYHGEYRYMVHDLGAAFGKTGGIGSRSKNNLDDYAEERFIKKVSATKVDLVMKSRPPFILAIDFPYYEERARIPEITKDIPIADARWIGRLLAKLSDRQLRDAFLAAGYSPSDAQMFADVLKTRIRQLQKL